MREGEEEGERGEGGSGERREGGSHQLSVGDGRQQKKNAKRGRRKKGIETDPSKSHHKSGGDFSEVAPEDIANTGQCLYELTGLVSLTYYFLATCTCILYVRSMLYT